MNNTHVYDLRKTPQGYSGKTSLYDGTRLIQINGAAGTPAQKDQGRNKYSPRAAVQQESRKHPDRSGRQMNPHAKNGQPRRQAPESVPEAQSRADSRKNKGDITGNTPRSSDGRHSEGIGRGNIRETGSGTQLGNPPKYINESRHTKGKKPPVFLQGSNGQNRAPGGSPKDRATSADTRRKNERNTHNAEEFRTNDRRQTQYVGRETQTDMYSAAKAGINGQNTMRNGESRAVGRSPDQPSQNSSYTHTRIGNIEDGRGRRAVYPDTGHPSGRKDPKPSPSDYTESHTVSAERMTAGQRYMHSSRDNRQNNRGVNRQLRENGREEASHPNPYNPNPVYSYGSRSSGNPPEKRRARDAGPAQNERVRQHKKPKMTAEERRMMAAAEEARKKAEAQLKLEANERKKAKKKLRRVKIRKKRITSARELGTELFGMLIDSVPLFAMFLAATALVGGLAVVSFSVALRINFSGSPDEIIYQIGEDKESGTETVRLSAAKYISGGVLYMSMNDFAERFEFTTVGTPDELKYISRVSENIMKVKIGSSYVTVNGIPLRLSAPVIRSGNEILVPYDFFASYVSGFSISYDEEKYKIKLLRDITDYTVSVGEGKLPVYASIGFLPSGYTVTPNINENSLPSDIYAATDPNPPPPEPVNNSEP